LSTILNALKKLEHELPQQTDTLPGAQRSTRQTIGRRVRRFTRFHKLFWIALGTLGLAAIAWVALAPFSPRSRQPTGVSSPDKTVEIAKRPSSGLASEKNIKPSVRREISKFETPLPANRTPTRSQEQKVPRETTALINKLLPLKSNQPRLPPKNVDAKRVSAQPLKDSKLILQAISWSEKPENRIAVINASIVREGQSIEGFRVIQIGQDDVVVRGSGKEWKLVFGLK
jgi:hypothetical protein